MEIIKEDNTYMIKNDNQKGGLKKKKPQAKKAIASQKKEYGEFDLSRVSTKNVVDEEFSEVEFSNNMIDIESVYKFIDLYFKQKNIIK